MRNLRHIRTVTALLLVGSAVLSFAAAWQRWGGFCGVGMDESPDCLARQDGRFDAIGSMPQLQGLASVLLAAAVVLMPYALGRRSSAWHLVPLVIGALTLLLAGLGALPGTLGFFTHYLLLPVLLILAVCTPDADGRRVGPRGGFVAWMLVCATPVGQLFFAPWVGGGTAIDTSPWTEAVVAPFLVAAAIALRPWRTQRSSSRPHRPVPDHPVGERILNL